MPSREREAGSLQARIGSKPVAMCERARPLGTPAMERVAAAVPLALAAV